MGRPPDCSCRCNPACFYFDPQTLGFFNIFNLDLSGENMSAPFGLPDEIPVYIVTQVERDTYFGRDLLYPNTPVELCTLIWDIKTWRWTCTVYEDANVQEPNSYNWHMDCYHYPEGGYGTGFIGHIWTDEMVAATGHKICWGPVSDPNPNNLFRTDVITFNCCALGGGYCHSPTDLMTYPDFCNYIPYFLYKRPQEFSVVIEDDFICPNCTTPTAGAFSTFTGTFVLTRCTCISYRCGNFFYEYGRAIGPGGGLGGVGVTGNCPLGLGLDFTNMIDSGIIPYRGVVVNLNWQAADSAPDANGCPGCGYPCFCEPNAYYNMSGYDFNVFDNTGVNVLSLNGALNGYVGRPQPSGCTQLAMTCVVNFVSWTPEPTT